MVTRVKNTENDKGIRGIAIATKLSDTNLRLVFEENGKQVDFVVVEGSIPDSFPFASMVVNKSAQLSVTLNVAEDKMLFVNPASGEFTAKFSQFVAPQGQAPTPETKKGKKAGSTYRTFAGLLEIVEGRWKGTKYWYPLYCNFSKDEDGNLAVSGTGSGSDALFEFLEATGVNSHVVPFSENPLPLIQKLAQEEDKTFKISVVKGWVTAVFPPFSADDAFGEVSETPLVDKYLTSAPVEDDLDVDKVHPALS